MSVTRVSPPGDGQNARPSKWEGHITSPLPTPPPPAPAALHPSVSPGCLCWEQPAGNITSSPSLPASEEPLAWNAASETALLGSGIG